MYKVIINEHTQEVVIMILGRALLRESLPSTQSFPDQKSLMRDSKNFKVYQEIRQLVNLANIGEKVKELAK